MNPLRDIKTFFSLLKLYKKLKPNIVHHVTIKPILYGGIAARLMKIPKVIHAISGLGYLFTESGLKYQLLRFLVLIGYRFSFSRHSVVIVQNNEDKQILMKHSGLKEQQTRLILGSGVSVQEFIPLPEPQGLLTVLFAARLLKHKGIIEFVGAAKLLKQHHAICFAVAGDRDPGNPSSIDQQQLQRWIDEGIIDYWGWQADVRQVFAKANIVCLPSYREGAPKVLIEASACGRAIVTTDVPGCRDVVKDQETGLIVPPKNTVALADAIGTLITHPALRQCMAQQGRQFVERHCSLQQVIDNTINLYR